MASLYRPRIVTYKLNGRCRTPDGQRVTKATPGAARVDCGLSPTWWGKVAIGNGRIRRVKLATDKTASKQILSKLVVDAKLAEHDLGGRFAEHAKRPLADHAEDFRRYLASKGNPPEYVKMTLFRVCTALNDCRFVVVADVQASVVQDFLHGLVKAGKTTKTVNDYLAALKRFTRWLRSDKRTPSDLLADVAGFSRVDGDQRHPRREFTVDELDRLLAAARGSGKVQYGLSGHDRYALYLCACSTGLRVSELASMTPESFQLATSAPVVRVRASCTKNKREAVQPVPVGVAGILRQFIADKIQGKPVWPGRWIRRAAKMIRTDLESARASWIAEAVNDRQRDQRNETDYLAYIDADGRYGDFHALRHSYITMVGESGISPREHQDLARHSTYTLTAKYSHSRSYNLDAAVQSLPIPTGTAPLTCAATGTDGPARRDRALTKTVRFPAYKLRQAETEMPTNSESETMQNTREKQHNLPESQSENITLHSTIKNSGIRESNPSHSLGKAGHDRYTNPACPKRR